MRGAGQYEKHLAQKVNFCFLRNIWLGGSLLSIWSSVAFARHCIQGWNIVENNFNLVLSLEDVDVNQACGYYIHGYV